MKPYRDPVNKITVGWGHYGDVNPDIQITREQAKLLLKIDVETAENMVRYLVKIPLSQGQFDALVDFAFNLGYSHLRESTLLRKLNEGDVAGAAKEFGKWKYGSIGGKYVELPGLVKRRERERQLFTGQ